VPVSPMITISRPWTVEVMTISFASSVFDAHTTHLISIFFIIL
jgi:hypothetical protein